MVPALTAQHPNWVGTTALSYRRFLQAAANNWCKRCKGATPSPASLIFRVEVDFLPMLKDTKAVIV